MNSNDILDALENIEEACIKNAKEAKKKKNKTLWISMGAAAACLALALSLPQLSHLIKEGTVCDCDKHNITPTPAPNKNDTFVGAYAGDTRERNTTQISSAESAILWPWEYRMICDQYPTVDYNDITYRCRVSYSGQELSETWVGTKLGDATAQGYDDAFERDELHSVACELYEINGVTSDRFLAVKYANQDKYYVFMQGEYNPPATLGELITSLNLPETFPFTAFSSGGSSKRYGITAEGSDGLWKLFSTHAAATTLSNEPGPDALPLGETALSFTVDAEALGVSNLAWTLTYGGYLKTNIENYGYYYYLGTDAVEELADYALSHKTEASAKEIYMLIGEVTEIGEDYIKVDDTLCMKNPADGMEFTIELNDIRVKRHVLCGYLTVGDHVLIRHTDEKGGNPTVIQTAYELNTGSIDADGSIMIPE